MFSVTKQPQGDDADKWRRLDRWLGENTEPEVNDDVTDKHQAQLNALQQRCELRAAEARRLALERDLQWERETNQGRFLLTSPVT